jgi:hypothetical protein
MAVPGVDMCNHSYQPNATVRLVHSPAACQGLDALEEVAPVAAAAACPSYFQLVAGELGLWGGGVSYNCDVLGVNGCPWGGGVRFLEGLLSV